MAKILRMKLFHEHSQQDLESAMNAYLVGNDLQTQDYIDCKYQFSVSGTGGNETHHFCVLLVFRKAI